MRPRLACAEVQNWCTSCRFSLRRHSNFL